MSPTPAFAAPASVVAKPAFHGGSAASTTAARPAASTTTMLYGKARPVQIIPSVLPADWANMGADCKRLEDAGVDRIQVRPAPRVRARAAARCRRSVRFWELCLTFIFLLANAAARFVRSVV